MRKAIANFAWFFASYIVLGTAQAGIASTSASCTIDNQLAGQVQSQTGTTSCFVQDLSIPAPLSSSGSAVAGPFFLTLQGSEFAGLSCIDAVCSSNDASLFASASYFSTLLTDGPVRPGYLQVGLFASVVSSPIDAISFAASLGPYSASVGRNGFCEAPLSPHFACTPITIPITLGVAINADLVGNIYAPINSFDGGYGANGTISLGFAFFEVDQTTEVGWTDVTGPEPSTALLCILPLALLFLLRRRLICSKS